MNDGFDSMEPVSGNQLELSDDEPEFSALEYTAELQTLCVIKAEEFHLLGYDEVAAKDVWNCVERKWKKLPNLHVAVSEILTLQVGQLMNYLTVSAYKGEFPSEDV